MWTPGRGGPAVALDDPAAGLRVLWDVEGFDGIDFELITSPAPAGQHGVRVDAVRAKANDLGIGLRLRAATRQEYLARSRALVSALNPLAGPGRLSVIEAASGSTRWIEAYCVTGTAGREAPGDGDNVWRRLPLRFVAARPFWHLPTVPEAWSIDRPRRRNWFPLLGRSPASSVVGGRRSLFVPGDVEVRPPWVIDGPGSGLLIRNHTADWEVLVDVDIPADGPASQVTVVTELGEQAIRDGYGNSLFGRITNGPDGGWEMGPLLPGHNDIEVRLDDSTAGTSMVSVTFDPLVLAV